MPLVHEPETSPPDLLPSEERVARASFGTAFGVAVLVCALSLWMEAALVLIPAISMLGSVLGYLLWRAGHRQAATLLGAIGLLGAGVLCHLYTGTSGGATGILLLAAVITAGGLGGRREAIGVVVIALLWLGGSSWMLPSLQTQLGLDPERPTVVYTGGLLEWKGVDLLVDAARELDPATQVVIAGGMEADVERLRARAHGQDNVRVDGFQPPSRVPLYMAAGDVGVVPNRSRPAISARYTSPLKVYESMAAGLPLVVSDLPSLRAILGRLRGRWGDIWRSCLKLG